MIYRSRWREIDGETLLMFLGFIVIVLTIITGLIMSMKQAEYEHEIELKKIELCGEEGE